MIGQGYASNGKFTCQVTFTERKNTIDNRLNQASRGSADEAVAAPGSAFANVNYHEYEGNRCPQNTGKSSASSGDWWAY